MNGLAIRGGNPVRTKSWPRWPKVTNNTEKIIADVLHSGRWAISGSYAGQECFERKFARAFASYNGTRYCVPCTSGSTALTLALRALDIGPDQEVLVPGLTWVACPAAVCEVGAIPILVDIDEASLCMSAASAEEAINEKTAAILLVHLMCSVADLDAFLELSERHRIPIIEDCAQSHGALWRKRRVGGFGRIGCFSMQQTKVLTSGEGGAVITDDPALHERLEQLRADGRRFSGAPVLGELELEERGEVLGRNYSLSEFNAALLLEGLERLDEEHAWRHARAEHLGRCLRRVGGVRTIVHPPEVNVPSYFNYPIILDLAEFGNHTNKTIARALQAELNVAVKPIYPPLNQHRLYNPSTLPLFRSCPAAVDPKRFDLPKATEISQRCVCLPHQVLLADDGSMEDIALAVEKVKRHSSQLSSEVT